MGRLPSIAEIKKPVVATFRTGAMSGRQRRHFVEEEQLGVTARRHHGALTLPKRQDAYDPPLQLPCSPDVPFGVMQNASIAHEGAPFRGGNDVAERSDTVLLGHFR